MKGLITLIVFVRASSSQPNVSSCRALCQARYVFPPIVCFSDGNVYSDSCDSQCVNKDAVKVYDCLPSLPRSDCDKNCKALMKRGSCEDRCKIIKFPMEVTCFSDGNVYADKCRANCASPAALEVFSCPLPLNFTKCSYDCARIRPQTCESKCPVYKQEQKICFSNGALYDDACRAECDNPNIFPVFMCPSPLNKETCLSDCQQLNPPPSACLENCPKSVLSPLACFSDGALYANSCTAACYGSNAVQLWQCTFPVNADKCGSDCRQTVAVKKPCESGCTMSSTDPLICYSNGKVFSNKCIKNCQRDSLKENFACGKSESFLDCSRRCREMTFASICFNRCRASESPEPSCFSDGRVYTDPCQALCGYVPLQRLFTCPRPFNSQTCSQTCSVSLESSQCENNCPLYIQRQSQCFSDGKVRIDQCRADCDRKGLSLLFTCDNALSDNECEAMCERFMSKEISYCKSRCNDEKIFSCTKDGRLILGACSKACENTSISVAFMCYDRTVSLCQTRCNELLISTKCQSQCPLASGNGIACYENGNLYDSPCLSRCSNPSAVKFFDCNSLGFGIEKCGLFCLEAHFACTNRDSMTCKSKISSIIASRGGSVQN